MEERKCLICKTPLIKRAHESNKRFNKKRFCSAACSRVWMKQEKVGWFSNENRSPLNVHEDWL